MNIYIISWFNNRLNRVHSFKELIHHYLKLDYKIVVLWMNDEKYKISHPNINYINSKVINASAARNQLLKIFYNSDQNEAVFSDDDVQILTDDLLQESFNGNDIVTFISHIKRKPKTFKYPFFSSTLFKVKKNSTRVFFDENLQANQDLDFGYNCFFNKLKIKEVYTAKLYNNKENSVMFLDEDDRKKKKKETFNLINKKYGITL
ncbi:hypothetical protein [Flavobacterium sharifuzzamanii]|uniref:hypothetical protein n=1 Tax=Flavobacterium sharifuzzamanii TaxID=2211133 RepID=UPI000DABF3CA|nr:hypothetical protein [Flavobacterium sharifuzzamanii]KAF2082133.1 hypothetical protein DMA14_06580 [Flavobacterium sharifuzzamanii]